MDASVKTRLIRTVAAMVVEVLALIAVVAGLALMAKVGAGTLPLVLGGLVFVAISLAILAILTPRLATFGGAMDQGTGPRGLIATFAFGYIGNGAIHALIFVRDIVTSPHDWADIALLNTVSRTIEVAAGWPATLANLVGHWVG